MDENKKQTLIAFVRLLCMLVTTGATLYGVSIDADALFVGAMAVLAVISYVWGWWKNNNVTKAATEAQSFWDAAKKGVSVTIDDKGIK